MKTPIRERSPQDRRAKEKVLLAAALSLITILYLSTLSANHSEAEDSLFYLMTISHGSLSEQFHPNHLLYNFVNYLFFHVWRYLGFEGNAEVPAKVLNVAASLSSLVVLYLIAALLRIPVFLRHLVVLATAFSFGFWWYTVECETYVFPVLFVLLCFHRLLVIQEDFLRPANHVLLGVFHGLAMLFHQQHVLLGVVLWVAYFMMIRAGRPRIPWTASVSRALLYAGTSFFLVASSYLFVAVFINGISNPAEIADWILGRRKWSPIHYGYWSIAGLFKAAIGFSRTLIGGHFLFSFPAVSEMLGKMIPGFMLREEVFLVRDFGAFRKTALCGLSFAFFALGIFVLLRSLRLGVVRLLRSREVWSRGLKFMLPVFSAYLTAYTLFNIWFDPQNTEFWIALVPVFFLVLGLLLSPVTHDRGVGFGMGAAVTCLFLVNFFGSVLPQTDRKNDYWYAFNSWLIRNCAAEDLLVSGSGWNSDAYVMYYSGARVFSIFLPGGDLEEQFQETVDSFRPGRILLSSTVYDPPEEYLKRLRSDNSRGREFFEKRRDSMSLIHADAWQQIYVCDPVSAAK